MIFESPNFSSEEKGQSRKLLDRLEKIKTRLENQELDKSDEVESIKEKIRSVQADLQHSAESEQSAMSKKEYEKEPEQSEDVKSVDETELSTDEGNEAVGLEESFIDISSENIISSLPKKQARLIRRYSDLFTELNQAKTPEERSDIFNRYQKAQGFSKHDSEQRRLYDLVVKLKEQYS
jgi:hypothetical protein